MQQTITATRIDSKPVDETMMIKPKKGKKVTQEEFDTIVAEKMKEMGAEGDGKGHHVIMEINVEK